MTEAKSPALLFLEQIYRPKMGLAEGEPISTEDLLHAVMDHPLSHDDLEAVFNFIRRQKTDGVEGVMVFDSGKPGPTLGITAITHGNEIAGLATLPTLIILQEMGLIQHGKVIYTADNMRATAEYFQAYRQDDKAAMRTARSAKGDINMNRLPTDTMDPGHDPGHSYAQARARELKPFWDQFDVGIDLHTTSTPAPPMIITHDEPDEKRKHLFANLPSADWITGIYDYLNGYSVTDFFGRGNPQEKAVTLTLECGQHLDPLSAQAARNGALTLMENLGLVMGGQALDRSLSPTLNNLKKVSIFNHFRLPRVPKGSEPPEEALFHPAHDPKKPLDKLVAEGRITAEFADAIRNDTFVLVNGREEAGKPRLLRHNDPVLDPKAAVWLNFERVEQGDVIARGEKTGVELIAPRDGHILMAPANPVIDPKEMTEAIAFSSDPVEKMMVVAATRDQIVQGRDVLDVKRESAPVPIKPASAPTQKEPHTPEPKEPEEKTLVQNIKDGARWAWNRATYPVRWGWAKVRGHDAPPVDPHLEEEKAAKLLATQAKDKKAPEPEKEKEKDKVVTIAQETNAQPPRSHEFSQVPGMVHQEAARSTTTVRK